MRIAVFTLLSVFAYLFLMLLIGRSVARDVRKHPSKGYEPPPRTQGWLFGAIWPVTLILVAFYFCEKLLRPVIHMRPVVALYQWADKFISGE